MVHLSVVDYTAWWLWLCVNIALIVCCGQINRELFLSSLLCARAPSNHKRLSPFDLELAGDIVNRPIVGGEALEWRCAGRSETPSVPTGGDDTNIPRPSAS